MPLPIRSRARLVSTPHTLSFTLAPLLGMLLWATFAVPGRSQNVIISEFCAANGSALQDEDGEFSDWIEIYNAEPQAVSLSGWSLSNDSDLPTQWPFPEVSLPGQSFLVVFASGKDRRDPKKPLHTNFSLDREGEYLALTLPDGRTRASEFTPTYPRQVADSSYGKGMQVETERLVSVDATARLLVPNDNQLGRAWLEPGFADDGWLAVTTGIGYDRPSTAPPEPSAPLSDVTRPGDRIVGTSANSPTNEEVEKAIDNNSATKYLNFDKLNAGLTVTPTTGASVVTGLRFTSANDAPDRDPTRYLLLGSADGRIFTEIAQGQIPDFSGRFVTVEVAFTNQIAYTQYRLLFPTVRNAAAAVAVQIAEVEFLGQVGPALTAFPDLIQTSVEAVLFGRNATAYLRFPFSVAGSTARERLALRVRYDDGFVAYLNGVEVARANAPAAPAWNSSALTNRTRVNAVQEQQFDLRSVAALLHVGANLLAVQALNDRADSSDFLFQAQLENSEVILGESGYFGETTPGRDNGPNLRGFLSDLSVQPQRGFYEIPIEVTVAAPGAEAIIRYTTNGTSPSATNGIVYAGAIRLDRTTTLRAIAHQSGWQPSRVATHTYIFLEDVIAQRQANSLAAGFPGAWNGQAADYGLDPRVAAPAGGDSFGGKYSATLKSDLQSLPSLSIVMDTDDLFGPEGIYSNPLNHGDYWERAVSLELMSPEGGETFQADAGLRIQGGAFRRFDLSLKKSFRVVFREKYGRPTLSYPLFGSDAAGEFDNFVLRANSNDAWPYGGGSAVYVRDAFAMETARAMGMVASHTRFVHLYLNGLYWGLYNPVERPDAAFSATYHGGDKDTWDAINQDSVPNGNYDAWNRLMSLLNQGLSSTNAFQRVQGNNPDGTRNASYENLLDVDNMIDYMILNFYVGNTDWPGRNWWVGRNRDQGEGFQFYPWDTETALGLSGVDVDRTSVADAVARPYAAARSNAEFRLRFADRVYRHFFHGGVFYVNPASPTWNSTQPENNRPAARFVALADQVRRAVVGESARWGDQLGRGFFTRDEYWQRERDRLLTSYFPRRSALVLEQFRKAGLYPRTEPPVMNQQGGPVEPGFSLVLTAPQGTIYYTTNGIDPRVGTAPAYSQPIPLQDLTTIKARARNGQEWSALNEATFEVGSPALGLTELHYHPLPASDLELATGFTDADDFEFIELQNHGSGTLDLKGFRFVLGIRFEFTNSVRLGAGQYLLLVRNQGAFKQRYGTTGLVAGEYSGQLDNAGERIVLVNEQNAAVLDFTYDDEGLWPKAADGQGASLQLMDTDGDLSSPMVWEASAAAGGTPGLPSPRPDLAVHVLGWNAEQLRVRFPGRGGMGYTLYGRETLSAGDWEILRRGETIPQDRDIETDIPVSPTAGSWFFRVSVP